MGQSYDARNPDFSPFAAHGGKLFLIHGWNDIALPPEVAIDYYKRVQAKMGPQVAASFVRLYMVPGTDNVRAAIPLLCLIRKNMKVRSKDLDNHQSIQIAECIVIESKAMAGCGKLAHWLRSENLPFH